MYTLRFHVSGHTIIFNKLGELWKLPEVLKLKQVAFDNDEDDRLLIGDSFGQTDKLRVYIGENMFAWLMEND